MGKVEERWVSEEKIRDPRIQGKRLFQEGRSSHQIQQRVANWCVLSKSHFGAMAVIV